MQFLKTGILRYKWYCQPTAAASNGGNPRRKSLPLGGAATAEGTSATTQRPKRQSQEVISAFLNAHLPVAYRTGSSSSESLPLGTAEPHPLHPSVTTGETPMGEDLTASMVLVHNHLQLNEKQVLRGSGTVQKETGRTDESKLVSPVPNSHTSAEHQNKSRENAKFGPKEFLNFAHDSLRFRFPSLPSRPEQLQSDGELTNSLFCLANEAARPVCSGLWFCRERVQRALLAVMGRALDR